MIQQTLSQLKELRLSGMANALAQQLEQPNTYDGLSFEERLQLLTDSEAQDRENRKQQRLRGVAIFAKDFSGLPARKISKKLRDRQCLRLPRSVLVTSFRPNKGSKHRFQMT